MFQETFIGQLADLCPLSVYVFVHNSDPWQKHYLYMQSFTRCKHVIFAW
jgi:hypothetical protein